VNECEIDLNQDRIEVLGLPPFAKYAKNGAPTLKDGAPAFESAALTQAISRCEIRVPTRRVKRKFIAAHSPTAAAGVFFLASCDSGRKAR